MQLQAALTPSYDPSMDCRIQECSLLVCTYTYCNCAQYNPLCAA